MTIALVTGANRGIGLALCRQLHARGARVVAACRATSPDLDALGVEVAEGFDVTSEASVASLAGRLAGRQLDLLINNAGVLTVETLEDLDFDRMRTQFEINALGPLRVTRALLGLMPRGAKVIMVTSRMGSIADNGSGGYYGYRMSKAALNMASVSLALDLRERGVAVGIVHPGMVATAMVGFQGIPPEQAAQGILARADALELETSGRFWHANGEPLPW